MVRYSAQMLRRSSVALRFDAFGHVLDVVLSVLKGPVLAFGMQWQWRGFCASTAFCAALGCLLATASSADNNTSSFTLRAGECRVATQRLDSTYSNHTLAVRFSTDSDASLATNGTEPAAPCTLDDI